MNGTTSPPSPIVAVGAVILRDGQVVLVRRSRPPRLHEWSIPGGKVEWGESVEQALRREIREETGLEIEPLGLIDVVDAVIRDDSGAVDRHYVLIDFAARPLSGTLQAGDDVSEAVWVSLDGLNGYPMWSETRRIIARATDLAARG
jgi:8-oxo-dGTP diphosphatase